MDITALLSQRVASVASVPAGNSAGDFANVLQSVAVRSAYGQAAPLAPEQLPMPTTVAGNSGSRLPLQFTVADLQTLPSELATATDGAETSAINIVAAGDEPFAGTAQLQPETLPLAHPGAMPQLATQAPEPLQPALPALDGRQSTQPAPVAGTTETVPVPMTDTATAMAPIATTVPSAPIGGSVQAPIARAATSTPAELRSSPTAATTSSATVQLTSTQAMDASLAVTGPATGAAIAPSSAMPLPEVDWSRSGAAEPQRGPAEPVGNAALTSSALAGTSSSAPQPVMSSLLQASLTAPVASPAWQQQLGSQLTGLAQRGRQQIELHLNPADLGPLSVSLKVDDQGAQAQFLSAHASVRAAVEQAIPQLREALAEQGIALGETSVGEQQRHGNEQSGTGQGPVSTTAAAGFGDTADGAVDTAATALTGDLSGVDIYA